VHDQRFKFTWANRRETPTYKKLDKFLASVSGNKNSHLSPLELLQGWVLIILHSLDMWQNKIRHLRQFLRDWARSLSGNYKVEKEHLLNIIDILDKKAEISPLNDDERRTLRSTNDAIAKLRRDEESNWAKEQN
jgi:hypothetical protein